MFNKAVKLSTLIERFKLDILYLPKDAEQILISAHKVNSLGLRLVKFYEDFKVNAVQVIGDLETVYLKELNEDDRFLILLELFKKKIPLVIIDVLEEECKIFSEIKKVARICNIPLLKTINKDHMFMSYLECFLNERLVLNSSIHGVCVEVYGEGVLIKGNSGIGKTELAVELIKKGHKLIADDKVYIVRVGSNNLKARAFDNIRNFVEIKGIGVVNIEKMYGMQALKFSTNIDFMVELKKHRNFKNKHLENYKEKVCEVLGVKIPTYLVGVNHYCNLPLKIEFLAMKNKHKKIGYDSQKQLFNIIKNNDVF